MLQGVSKFLSVFGIAIFAVGCASTNVRQDLDASFWENKDEPIAVSIASLPKPGHFGTGSQGLLDIAINQGNAQPIIDHMQTISLEDYNKAVPEISAALKAQGFNAVEITENVDVDSLPEFDEPNDAGDKVYSDHDFSTLREKYKVNRMILVRVTRVGTQRNYYGFIPTGAPSAITWATCELIDLNTNELLWRKPFNQQMAVDEPWDQPTSYPNITRALEKAMLMSRKSLPEAFNPTLVKSTTAQANTK